MHGHRSDVADTTGVKANELCIMELESSALREVVGMNNAHACSWHKAAAAAGFDGLFASFCSFLY